MVSGFAQDFHDVIDIACLALVIERRCNGVGRFRAVLYWGCGGCFGTMNGLFGPRGAALVGEGVRKDV